MFPEFGNCLLQLGNLLVKGSYLSPGYVILITVFLFHFCQGIELAVKLFLSLL